MFRCFFPPVILYYSHILLTWEVKNETEQTIVPQSLRSRFIGPLPCDFFRLHDRGPAAKGSHTA